MLSIRHLSCSRGERLLFRRLELNLAAGQWLHVRGANGRGKTTLLRVIAGLSQPDEAEQSDDPAEILWNGVSITDNRHLYLQEMLFMGHRYAVKEELSGFENLRFTLALDQKKYSDVDLMTALSQVGLKGREHLPVRDLSEGQKKRILLARLVLRRAKLWILDEPFNALDVDGVALLSTLILQHLSAGGLVILTSHQPIPLRDGMGQSLTL